MEHKISHGEADTERGPARSAGLGRRNEQNRRKSVKCGCIDIDATTFHALDFSG